MGLASHPAAEESERTGKAPHARSDDVQDLAGRGLRAQKKMTVLTTSSSQTSCRSPVFFITGWIDNAASPRISALPPKAARPITTDGRRMTQSRVLAFRDASPACLLAENDVVSRSTPMAER